MILDLFAGPRGWSEGLRMLGLSDVGIEWDHAACLTAQAAGHPSIRADVAEYPIKPFVGKVTGLIASPPCQAWSMAGKRKGEFDRAKCHALVDAMAEGKDDAGIGWEDPRSQLVAQPVRWVRDLRPEWVALEQVPAVLGLWQHVGRIYRGWGYSVWTGVLNAADYGVPQTRRRAFLLAHRSRSVQPPEPTHCPGGGAPGLFGDGRLPWVSMAEALGWDGAPLGYRIHRGAGMTDRHGPRPDTPAEDPAPVVTSKARTATWVVDRRTNSKDGRGGMAPTVPVPCSEPAPTLTSKAGGQWLLKMGNTENATAREPDEPAPTVFFGHRSNKVEWIYERPATTVVGSFCPDVIAAPGYRTSTSRQNAEASVRVTVAEASVLQSFRPDYPWQGSRTKQFEQIGNAVPPLLAAHVIAAVTGLPLDREVAA